MKTLLRIGLFFVISFCLVFIFYLVLKNTMKREENPKLLSESENNNDVSDVNADDGNLIGPDTKFTIIESYTNNEINNIYDIELPEIVVGMNRDEVISYYEGYLLKPSEEDIMRGLINVEVSTFSKKSVIIKKTYEWNRAENTYYAIITGSYIDVYYGDRKTIYFETDIRKEELPRDIRDEMKQGKFFMNLDELYNFLESYTS